MTPSGSATVSPPSSNVYAPLYHLSMSSPTVVSFTGLALCFFLASPHYPTNKQTSWIVTTISSFVMSLASLPFLWDYILGGGSVQHIRPLPVFAVSINRFFQSYLAADLVLGTIFYRSQLSFVEGWIHHSVYLVVVELAIRRSWSHIFCLCASMEIPTFILGFTTLYPKLRNNTLFACSFFATRIFFHIVLAVACLSEETRAHATGGSFIPSIILASVLPLHIVWFIGCIKGFVRRAAEIRPPQNPPTINFDIIPVTTTPSRLSTPTHDRISTDPSSPPLKVRPLPHHLHSFEDIFETFCFEALDSRFGELWFWSPRAVLSRREIIYECVGLGRPSGTFRRGK